MKKAVKPVNLDSPKAQQILTGAKDAFFELGYEGTSVEEIARRAGVSKGTLYNYFPDKQTLFAVFVEGECEKHAKYMCQVVNDYDDVEVALRQVANKIIKFTTSPFAQSTFRVAVAESQRFPELGRVFYHSGPDVFVRQFAQYLAAADATGKLRVPDPELAAHQFIQLCKADLFHKVLLGIQRHVNEEEVQRIADAAVETFLKAFKPESRI
jgi:AcrR family transcriptional regulator